MPLPLEASAIQQARAALEFRTQAFIDGRFVDAASGKTFTTENPARGEPLAEIAACDAEDIDRAVRAARAAFESGVWSRRSPSERKAVLLRFAELIEQHDAELALLDALEAGKPICDCVNIDVPETAGCIRWHAEAVDKLYDQVAPTGPEALGLIVREPIGVVGAVIPWNFPALMAAWKLGPALATGNSVILKPAEQTSLSALRLGELAAAAGLPDGVLSVVPGLGETAGQAIGRHGDVDAVTIHRLDRSGPSVSSSTRPSRTSNGSCWNAAARARRSCWPTPRTSTRWPRTPSTRRSGTWARTVAAARG